MLIALTPASYAAKPGLFFTMAVYSSPSWHCCHGRRKDSSVEVQSSVRTVMTDPARDQSTAPKTCIFTPAGIGRWRSP
jgi:hypothetical protein